MGLACKIRKLPGKDLYRVYDRSSNIVADSCSEGVAKLMVLSTALPTKAFPWSRQKKPMTSAEVKEFCKKKHFDPKKMKNEGQIQSHCLAEINPGGFMGRGRGESIEAACDRQYKNDGVLQAERATLNQVDRHPHQSMHTKECVHRKEHQLGQCEESQKHKQLQFGPAYQQCLVNEAQKRSDMMNENVKSETDRHHREMTDEDTRRRAHVEREKERRRDAEEKIRHQDIRKKNESRMRNCTSLRRATESDIRSRLLRRRISRAEYSQLMRNTEHAENLCNKRTKSYDSYERPKEKSCPPGHTVRPAPPPYGCGSENPCFNVRAQKCVTDIKKEMSRNESNSSSGGMFNRGRVAEWPRAHVVERTPANNGPCRANQVEIGKLSCKDIEGTKMGKLQMMIHPDKNSGCKDVSTAKFQKLQELKEGCKGMLDHIENLRSKTAEQESRDRPRMALRDRRNESYRPLDVRHMVRKGARFSPGFTLRPESASPRMQYYGSPERLDRRSEEEEAKREARNRNKFLLADRSSRDANDARRRQRRAFLMPDSVYEPVFTDSETYHPYHFVYDKKKR